MAFDQTKLTREHILEAIAFIDASKKLKFNPSTVYDLVYKEKRYPPKEVIRIAYRFATNKDVGIVYGGAQVNEPLRALGFIIEEKNAVWKLGCNWGKGAPSFYDFIKQERIVISTEEFVFRPGDLIAITEGFTVRAIAQVKGNMASVTIGDRFEGPFNELDIDYSNNVLFAGAQWYELQETEVFTYELQQGIRRIRRVEIVDTVIDIWENRNYKFSNFQFYSKALREPPSNDWKYPCFVFEKDSWDDYSFKTSHMLQLYKGPSQRTKIGYIKILKKGNNSTELPTKFRSLNKSYCSLGQTLEFYRRLKSEVGNEFTSLLKAINDCAFDRKIRKEFEKLEGFKDSLLRSSEAELALNTARKTLMGNHLENSFDFTYKIKMAGAVDAHSVSFVFNSSASLPNRFFCLVGRNGTGKTKFISSLANKLCNDKKDGEFSPARPRFSKIIATSFSYFDSFLMPRKEDISYSFIGIKKNKNILSQEETIEQVWKSLAIIFAEKRKKQLWVNSLKETLELNYLSFQIEELESISTSEEFKRRTLDIFSSGQNIVFHFLTQLISTIENNSLLIFDEPETHLHPNISGRLLRTLKKILDATKSFCIISTHSPIIVQEIPSRFIRIFERQDCMPIIYEPSIECLGENLSNISNAIFQADQEKELYKFMLETLANQFSLKEIQQMFERKLSLNASIYLQALKTVHD